MKKSYQVFAHYVGGIRYKERVLKNFNTEIEAKVAALIFSIKEEQTRLEFHACTVEQGCENYPISNRHPESTADVLIFCEAPKLFEALKRLTTVAKGCGWLRHEGDAIEEAEAVIAAAEGFDL